MAQAQVIRLRTGKKYKDPIQCPVCGKVFGEWDRVVGEATIKKKCPKCRKIRYISKKT